jgi:DNA-directed RNA polymerase subunit alpha
MIPLPLKPKLIEKKGNSATFEFESLYPGYGVTIGNALRRVLLSPLPGAAVTQMKIKGVSHEFSTIPGVLEDVIIIMLNLKQLRFKIYSDDPQKAQLKVKGEKEVRGSDFEFPSQVELVNKEAKIATITAKSAELEMEIQIEKGLGYQPVEKRKKGKSEIGVIPIDAIFTPIIRVSFSVENMRVGDRTDFDKLRIEIETDGTITPEKAIGQSAEILVKHFSLIEDSFKEEEEKPKPGAVFGEALKTKVEDLKISKRTLHSLQKNGIQTLGGILKRSEKTLLELDGMGEKGIKEIKKILKKLKLYLNE